MFKNNIVATQKAVTQTATHPALPAFETLRLRSENGNTDRGNSLIGNLTIAHSPTKELGGGYRHVVRMNYRAQGDIPGASAYVVIINQDSVLGEARALECLVALLSSLVSLDDSLTVKTSTLEPSGYAASFVDAAEADKTWQDGIDAIFTNVGPRLLGRES